MNREKKWTPGPWDVNTWRKTYRKYSTDHNGTFCIEIGKNTGSPMVCHNEEWEANGRLSLAAPELVEALESHCEKCRKHKQLFDIMNGSDKLQNSCDDCVTRTAIAKAYGESEES